MKQSNTFKRLGTGVVLTAFLVCCFFGATFTLHPNYAWAEAPANSLNNGELVISKIDQEKFEPGATIKREIDIRNTTANNVFYSFYFEITDKFEINDNSERLPSEKSLADVLDVVIYYEGDEENPVVSGKMSDLNGIEMDKAERAIVKKDDRSKYDVLTAANDATTTDERSFVLYIHYPENAGNEYQKQGIEFNFCLGFATVPSTTNP